MSGSSQFVHVDGPTGPVRIEFVRVGIEDGQAPCMVYLHEGLGSASMWRDFPHVMCMALGMRGLVFSRPGYGQSTPRKPEEQWDVDFMHVQAHRVLPAVLDALGESGAVWLFGHSDGASIALLFAAKFPARVTGTIVLAPHTFVEDKCITAIEAAREAYRNTDLPKRLARYHANPDSAFGGWNGAWLNPPFRQWNIDAEVATIRTPVLAIQGEDDEYGTLEQVRRIARNTPATTLLGLPRCGHSPHRDQPDAVITAVKAFCAR